MTSPTPRKSNPTAQEQLEDEAFKHVNSVVKSADITHPYPAWHGWALREAFIAGAIYQRDKVPDLAAHREALKKSKRAVRGNRIARVALRIILQDYKCQTDGCACIGGDEECCVGATAAIALARIQSLTKEETKKV